MQVRYVPRPNASVIKVSGRDRVQFIQGMVTNDVTKDMPMSGLRAFHLDNKGTVIYPMTLQLTSDAIYIDIEGASAIDVISTLDHYLVMERCSLKDASGGSRTYWLLGDIAGIFMDAEFTLDGNLHTYYMQDMVVHAFPILRRNGPCFVVWAVDSDAASVLDLAGCVRSEFATAELERLTAGIPAGCEDFVGILAMESGLVESTISFKKGCYIGQEITARIDARGRTHRELVAVKIDGLTHERDLVAAGQVVGHLRSCVSSDSNEMYGVCYLRKESRDMSLSVGPCTVVDVRNVL